MPPSTFSPRPPGQRRRIAVFAVLFASLSIANFVADTAESTPKDHDPVAGSAFKRCHDGKSLTQAQLQGAWEVVWQDLPSNTPANMARPEPLKFSPNAEHPDSLMGEWERDGRKIMLAGDFEDGELVLEESADGKRISATWTAQVKAGNCGTVFIGTRVADSVAETTPAAHKPRLFVMRRAGSW